MALSRSQNQGHSFPMQTSHYVSEYKVAQQLRVSVDTSRNSGPNRSLLSKILPSLQLNLLPCMFIVLAHTILQRNFFYNTIHVDHRKIKGCLLLMYSHHGCPLS